MWIISDFHSINEYYYMCYLILSYYRIPLGSIQRISEYWWEKFRRVKLKRYKSSTEVLCRTKSTLGNYLFRSVARVAKFSCKKALAWNRVQSLTAKLFMTNFQMSNVRYIMLWAKNYSEIIEFYSLDTLN